MSSASSGSAPSGPDFQVFFDGDCPLCSKEIGLLRRLDRRSRIAFTDIAAPDFDPADVGLDRATLMASIHGRTADGRLVEGVEVFRQLYNALGFGPLVSVTRLPGVRGLLDFAYARFAANRLRWTGRCDDGVCSTGAGVP